MLNEKYQDNLLSTNQKINKALDQLTDELIIAFVTPYADNTKSDYDIVWVWTDKQKGVVHNTYSYLKEGVEIQVTDTGVKFFIETPYGTTADITLNNSICTTANIKQTLKMALEGTK